MDFGLILNIYSELQCFLTYNEHTYILNSIIFLIKAPSDDGGSPVTQYKVEMRDVDRRAWNDVGELNITSNWEDIFDIIISYIIYYILY